MCLHVYLIIDPRIIRPPDNSHTVTFDELSSSVQLMCSLNVTIPSSVIVIWTHDANLPPPNSRVTKTGNTTTLLIENPQPIDAGVYQCTFINHNNGWYLQRNVNLG